MIDTMEGTLIPNVQNVALEPDELHQIHMKKLLMVSNRFEYDVRKMATMLHRILELQIECVLWYLFSSCLNSICIEVVSLPYSEQVSEARAFKWTS